MSSTGGQYNLFVGAYDAPVRAINDDNLAGDINCTPLQSIKGAFNTVKALYFRFLPLNFLGCLHRMGSVVLCLVLGLLLEILRRSNPKLTRESL
jgi:hypothetical protein